MTDKAPKNLRTFRICLIAVFVTVLVLGPGLGAHLIGGDPDNVRFLFGVPALYLWLVFCFLIMAGCVLVAARTFWRDSD
jgi:hypothetical protein